jgi:hypothetical protein
VPDGWPIWTSDVRPGREHDTTTARTHPEILPAFQDISDDLWTLGDLGYEGEAGTITVAFEKPKNAELTDTQQRANKAHNGIRAVGERGNEPPEDDIRALRNVSLNPWRIGEDRRRGTRPAPHRPRPHHHLAPLINQTQQPNTTTRATHSDERSTVLPAPAPTTAPPTRTRSPKCPGAIPPPMNPRHDRPRPTLTVQKRLRLPNSPKSDHTE